MAKAADNAQIAAQARQRYIDGLLRGLPGLVSHIGASARDLLDKPAEYLTAQRRRDLVAGLMKQSSPWQHAVPLACVMCCSTAPPPCRCPSCHRCWVMR